MQRFVYLFLALISLIVGVIYLKDLYEEVEDKTMAQLLKQQEIFAIQAAEGIENFFENCKNSLKYISKQKDIINQTPSSHNELIKFFLSFEGQITAVSRVDKKGVLIDTYPKSTAIGNNLSHQKHNQILMKENHPVISDVIDVVQGYKAVVYSYPIWKNGKYNGAIAILIPYKFIANKFLERIKIGTDGYAFMISENGIELYYPFDSHIGGSIFNNAKESPSVLKLANKMLEAKPGTTHYQYNRGSRIDLPTVAKLAFYQPIRLENTFWSVAVVVSKNDVLAINKGFNKSFVIVISLITTLIILMFSLYYYSKRRADLKLKEEEEKYKIIVEQTGQIIYNTDCVKNTISFAGAIKDVLDYDSNEFKELSVEKFIEYIHPDDRKKCKENSFKVREEGGVFNFVYRLKHKNGQYIYVEDNGTCVTNVNNICQTMIGTIKDISDRIRIENLTKQKNVELEKLVKERTEKLDNINKRLQSDIVKRKHTEEELKVAKQKAEKSDKLKSEFLAQMSHEIRTPVNSLLSFSNLIREETKDSIDSEIAQSFDVIDNAGRRITRTIDLILNMSQLQTGSYEANYQKFDFHQRVINNIYNEYNKIAKDKGLELRVSNTGPSRFLHADEYTVFQIFNNLVDNAVKYTPSGNVEIKVNSELDKKLKIEIIDTGIGISDEYLPKIFNAFSQEQQGYTRNYDGNGLGLALVKRYCEINNADIKVESQKGIGTKFAVTFENAN